MFPRLLLKLTHGRVLCSSSGTSSTHHRKANLCQYVAPSAWLLAPCTAGVHVSVLLTACSTVLAPAQHVMPQSNVQCIAWCADTRRRGGVWAGGALARARAAEEGQAAGPEVRAVGAWPFLSKGLRGVSAQNSCTNAYVRTCTHASRMRDDFLHPSALEMLHQLFCSVCDAMHAHRPCTGACASS